MPLVPHSDLPAFVRMHQEGKDVAASVPGLPDLRIGLLNLMPDAALEATDRQFIRLVSGYSSRANLYVYPFTVAAEYRSPLARAYVEEHYSTLEGLMDGGLDALIITGANPAHFELSDEPFWEGLIRVIDWGEEETVSTMCSCLATHAVLEHKGILKRRRLPEKRWGLYQHETVEIGHPLLSGVEGPVEAPHSHWFDMSRADLETHGVSVLVHGAEAGVHMAASIDGLRYVFFQGHPEYDDRSLLKEYKREVLAFLDGERDTYPPLPEHYFDDHAREVLHAFREVAHPGLDSKLFPEESVTRRWDPLWSRQGSVIYANWLNEVARRS